MTPTNDGRIAMIDRFRLSDSDMTFVSIHLDAFPA